MFDVRDQKYNYIFRYDGIYKADRYYSLREEKVDGTIGRTCRYVLLEAGRPRASSVDARMIASIYLLRYKNQYFDF